MLSYLKNKYCVAYFFWQTLATALEVGLSYVLMICIDYATGGRLSQMHLYLFGFLAYMIITFITNVFTGATKEKALIHITKILREKLMNNILKMNTSEYAKKNSGSYVAYITKNLERIESAFFYNIFNIYPKFLQFSTSIILLFVLDWRLAVFVILTSSFQILVPKFFISPQGNAEHSYIETNEKYTITVKEFFFSFRFN